jgi:cell division protein ZapA (FtsZ GTPase activity inhibitor)
MAYEDSVFPTFYMGAIRNRSESKKQQREVIDDVLKIKIVVPNQRDTVDRPATEADKKRFPKSWQAFLDGVEPPVEGHALEKWNQITKGELMMCQANHIKTVEQLAEIADVGLNRLGPGAQALKNNAKKFLAGLNETDELKKENAELLKRIGAQEERIDELVRAVEALTDDDKPSGERQRYVVEE